MRLGLLICGLVIGMAFGFLAGREWGQFHTLHDEAARRYEDDRKLTAPVLASDPAFGRLFTMDFPVAGFCVQGPVATQSDYNRLHAEMLRLFGEPRVGHIMQDVVVEQAAKPGAAADWWHGYRFG